MGFRSQFFSHYSHAHDERQLECASGKPLVDRLFVRHSVEQDSGAQEVAELQQHQLMAIDGDGAELRRVALLPLSPGNKAQKTAPPEV